MRSCARITSSQYVPSEWKPSALLYRVNASSFASVSAKLSKESEIKCRSIVAQGDFWIDQRFPRRVIARTWLLVKPTCIQWFVVSISPAYSKTPLRWTAVLAGVRCSYFDRAFLFMRPSDYPASRNNDGLH